MPTPTISVAPITTTDGKPFIIYTSGEGLVSIERVRPSGRRDSKSIFEFDGDALVAALALVGAHAVARVAALAAVASLVACAVISSGIGTFVTEGAAG